MKSFNFLIEVVLPFTNIKTVKGFALNFFYQEVYILILYIIAFVFMMLFVIFTVHILTEMMVMHAVSEKIGEYEEHEILNDGIIQVKEMANESSVSVEPDIEVITMESSSDDPNGLIKSSNLLLELIVMHRDVLWYSLVQYPTFSIYHLNVTFNHFRAIDIVTKLFSVSAVIWELFMIFLQSTAVAMYNIHPTTILIQIFPVVLFTLQYLVVSKISSAIEDSHTDIANSLYASKWYLLSNEDRKTMLRIMMMAQQTKTIKVGYFGESNLERFTDV